MEKIVLPEHLQKIRCVPKKTALNKFLSKYNSLLDEKNTIITTKNIPIANLSQLSKLKYLQEYMLNEKYSLGDLTDIPNVSLRGFVFETLWDICFKCGVVEDYTDPNLIHFKGKIEDVRMVSQRITDEFDEKIAKTSDAKLKTSLLKEKETRLKNVFKDQWTSLKKITDLKNYLETNKVQSGNTAGISDITFRQNKKYVFVSSKYYTDEKAVTNYDVESIVQAVKGLSIEYDVVLVVRNKARLMEKIKTTHKKHVVDTISKIYDLKDLEIALYGLRRLFKVFPDALTMSPQKRSIQEFTSINYYFVYTTKYMQTKNTDAVVWNCVDKDIVASSISLYTMLNPQEDCIVVSNISPTEKNSQHQHKNTTIFIVLDDDKSEVFDVSSINTNSCKRCIVILTTFHPINKSIKNFISYHPNTMISKSISQTVQEILSKDFVKVDQNKEYPKINFFNKGDNDIFKKSRGFKRYQHLFDDTFDISKVFEKDTAEKQKDIMMKIMFGTKMDVHEDFIVKNRLKLQQPSSFLCMLPTEECCEEFVRVFKTSAFIQTYFTIVSSSKRNIQSQEESVLATKKHFVNVCSMQNILDESLLNATSNIIVLCKINPRILKTLVYRQTFTLSKNKKNNVVNVMVW